MSEDKLRKIATLSWKINGIVLLALLVLGVGATLFAAITIGFKLSGAEKSNELQSVAGKNLEKEELRLARLSKIEGTEILFAELREPSDSLASSAYNGVIRNILFFDANTKKAHWLIDGNLNEIVDYDFLEVGVGSGAGITNLGYERKKEPARALIYRLRETGEDTNSTTKLFVAEKDGRNSTQLLDSVPNALGHYQDTTDTVLYFYKKSGVARVARIDIGKHELEYDSEFELEK